MPATSPAVVETVSKVNPAVTISAVPAAQSSLGQAVTFTAAVAPAAASGSVQFRDSGAAIGTAPLVNGVATFSTSTLKTGNHSITAAYLGDTNCNAAESAKLTHKVKP
jgi:large repetitive protein